MNWTQQINYLLYEGEWQGGREGRSKGGGEKPFQGVGSKGQMAFQLIKKEIWLIGSIRRGDLTPIRGQKKKTRCECIFIVLCQFLSNCFPPSFLSSYLLYLFLFVLRSERQLTVESASGKKISRKKQKKKENGGWKLGKMNA